MMFFNFQRFFAGFGSVLDPLLANENCTLEMILDDDTLVEIKNSGAFKFGNFVTKNIDVFAKMIGYLNVNEDEGDEKTQIRYPFMISEAIGNENGPIIDFLFESDKQNTEDVEEKRSQFLPQIFDIFDRDYLNVTLASYLSKVICAIVRRRGYDLWKFLSNNKHHITNLIKNLDVFHVAEIIEKLIILDTNQDVVENQPYYFEERNELLRRVIKVFEYKTHQNDIIENCSHIFNEVLNKAEHFLKQLNIPEKLFTVALNSSSTSVVQVIITLLEAINRFVQTQNEKHSPFTFDYERFFQIGREFLSALRAEKISLSSFESTYGVTQTPFSQCRLKLLQLYVTILKLNNEALTNSFDNKGIYKQLMEFVLQYEFNNQLQNYFYEITTYIFDRPQLEFLQNDILELEILEFIMTHNSFKKTQVGQLKGQCKRGYVGILSKLAYYFEKKNWEGEEWNNYLQGEIQDLKIIENNFMLGVNPKPQRLQDDTNEDATKDILAVINQISQKISQKTFHYTQQQQSSQDQQQDVEVEETEEQLEDQDAEDLKKFNEEIDEANKKNLEIAIDEETEKVIKSPETSPKVVEQIIQQFQEQTLSNSPQAVEIITDQAVNKFWKAHEGLEHQEPGRKSSSDDSHKHQAHHDEHDEDVLKNQENLQVAHQDVKIEEMSSPEEQSKQQDQTEKEEKQADPQPEQLGEPQKADEPQVEEQGQHEEQPAQDELIS